MSLPETNPTRIRKETLMTRILHDLLRVFVLLVVVGVSLYFIDPANMAVYQALLIGLFLVGGSHFTRRLLFSKLDLQSIALKAIQENNITAAVIFAAVIYFLVSVMELSMKVLHS